MIHIASLKRYSILALFLLLGGCGQPDPIQIAFVGGVSGRVADLGIAGRNGVILAVEQRNQSGGIHGAPIKLVLKDDKQDPDTARRVVAELVDQKVTAIIGHMTSSMSTETVPIVNKQRMLMLSPTTTADSLTGKDDYFFRIVGPTKSYAGTNAAYQYNKLGLHTIAAAYDIGNRAYAESWYDNFWQTFTKLGGKVVRTIPFKSGPDVHFDNLAKTLVESNADSVLIVASALDAALLIQQIRKLDAKIHISTSEWAATERFIELGGASVEHTLISQLFDRDNTSTMYSTFRDAYRQRFNQEPGFPSVAGYDAANVVMDALERNPDTSLIKQTILDIGSFIGAQGPIVIDRYGDASRKTYLTVVSQGKYKVIQGQ
ncbi:ABC transporter substrate-binding protein [Pseudomonadota bacterium]